jgi:small-conductance mechanosensitive channel
MISNILSTPFTRILMAAAVLGLAAGCGSTVDPSAAAVPPGEAAQAVQAAQAKLAGPGGFFLNQVEKLDLRADQTQKVASIRTSLETANAPVREARAALGAEVARQVRAGTLDATRTQPLIDQIKAAHAATKPAMQAAVQQIHDMLDAGQRSALVAAMQSQHEQFRAARAEHGQRMARVAAELGLSDEQVSTIRASMKAAYAERGEEMHAEHAQMKARMQALATAFQSDTFDARALDVGGHAAGAMGHFAGMRQAFLRAAVPVLSADQREKLASKIEARTQVAEEEE